MRSGCCAREFRFLPMKTLHGAAVRALLFPLGLLFSLSNSTVALHRQPRINHQAWSVCSHVTVCVCVRACSARALVVLVRLEHKIRSFSFRARRDYPFTRVRSVGALDSMQAAFLCTGSFFAREMSSATREINLVQTRVTKKRKRQVCLCVCVMRTQKASSMAPSIRRM